MHARATCRPRPGQAGFTLLELLAVVVIIAVTASLAVMSIGGGEDPLEHEAARFVALADMAREEAIMQERELALRVMEDRYEFLVLREDGWQTIEGEGPLRPREMPEKTTLELSVEGEAYALEPAPLDEDEAVTPQVYFLSSGETTRFALTLRAFLGGAQRVEVRENGKLARTALDY
jgi:general secretion pathway protein H